MKQYFIFCLCCVIFYSCQNKNNSQQNSQNKPTNGFVINGTLENLNSTKVYLNKISENTIYKIDSASINNNSFTFKGMVTYPERFVLSFNQHAATIILIIENSSIKININGNNINEPIITGSALNNELTLYKNASKTIFRKIDYLFPKFQKARLQNDVKKLEEIGNELKVIENEFTNFSYKYVEEHKNSFIAPIILSDQLKSSIIDTLRIKKSYNNLSNHVKKSPEAQTIVTTLNLH